MTEKTGRSRQAHRKKTYHSKVQKKKAARKKRAVKKFWKKILQKIPLVLVGLFVGIVLYLANAHKIVGNSLPMPFGYGIADVLSGSMEPTFSKGTLLLVKETEDVQTGDIVVYQSGSSLIVHRVVAVEGDTVTTQGDANNAPDDPFDKKEIKGIVVGWVPGLGTALEFCKTPAGMLLILALLLWLMEGSFRKEKETDEKELDAIREEIRRLKEESKK